MWKSLIQQEPSEAKHWTGLARSLEQAGDLETAAKCHAKAAAMDGTSTQEGSATVLQAPQTEAQVQTETKEVVNNESATVASDILTAPQPVVIQDATPHPEPVSVQPMLPSIWPS